MIEHDFGIARATVLEEERSYVDAAEEYWKEGRKLSAVESLLKDETNPESLRKAKDYILLILWGNISFAAQEWPDNSDTPLSEVARLTDELLRKSKRALPHEDQLEVVSYSILHGTLLTTNGDTVRLVSGNSLLQ
jgi:hypothetical protein